MPRRSCDLPPIASPHDAEELEQWTDFNVAMVGATAALAGLVIVASSVNIAEIIKSRALTARLAAGIATLVLAIVASGLGLVPTMTPAWFGILLLVATIGAGVFQVQATRAIYADRDPAARARFAKSVFGFLPIGAYLAAARSWCCRGIPPACRSRRPAASSRSSPRSWCRGSPWSRFCADRGSARGDRRKLFGRRPDAHRPAGRRQPAPEDDERESDQEPDGELLAEDERRRGGSRRPG